MEPQAGLGEARPAIFAKPSTVELSSDESKSLPVLSHVVTGKETTNVAWTDGTMSIFSNRVLRYACSCDLCGDTDRGLRIAKLSDLPRRPQLSSAEVDRSGRLNITWDDGHRTILDGRRLYSATPEECGPKPAPRLLWTRSTATAIVKDIPISEVLEADDRGLFSALRSLRDAGIVILRGGMPTPEGTEKVTARFGKIRETDYGRFFELKSVPNPQVAGATSRAQTPHTDEPFRYTPPGIFFLHCLKAGADMEGASVFVDGFAAAERLRETVPEAFDLLCREPISFHRRHEGTVDLLCRARVITLDEHGQVAGIRYNDRTTGVFNQPLAKVDQTIDAAAAFMQIVHDPKMQVTVMLQPGDVAICDNHRVMHGRRAFDPNRQVRHLRSCHVDRDQVHSRLRLLTARFAPGEANLSLAQGVAF